MTKGWQLHRAPLVKSRDSGLKRRDGTRCRGLRPVKPGRPSSTFRVHCLVGIRQRRIRWGELVLGQDAPFLSYAGGGVIVLIRYYGDPPYPWPHCFGIDYHGTIQATSHLWTRIAAGRGTQLPKMSSKNQKETGAEGLPNPFARGGIQRSPQKKAETDAAKSGGGKTANPSVSTPDISVDGPLLVKAVERCMDTRPRVAALSEQLDAIIEFLANRRNIAGDLKQSLLLLRSTIDEAREEHEELVARVKAAEKAARTGRATASKEVQTDAPSFAGR